ncbi:MAG: hypothetical protein GY857_14510 [Desulfobacula sp.]|nr:hypothetical protein [Desulfobacula sp.]
MIELIVVIVLISIMLFVAIPNFSGFLFTDNADKAVRWIMIKAKHLKERSVIDQKYYVLNANLDENRLWIYDETMDTEEALSEARKNGYEFPENVVLLDVEYPGRGIVTTGTAEIYFYKKGYSDRAIIHLGHNDEKKMTLVIESFLPDVKLYEE